VSAALVCAAALAAGGVGLAIVRTAPPMGRWLAYVVALGFVVVALAADDAEVRDVAARERRVEVAGDDAASRTALLAAAAHTGPRAAELTVQWRAPFVVAAHAADAGGRALGARAVAAAPLPFAPDDVHVRVPTELAVDRPATIEVAVDGLARELTGELRVTTADGGEEVLRQPVVLGPRAATIALLPQLAGRHAFSLHVDVDGHRLRCAGLFDVAAADEVLVVEPADVAAVALRAQGVRVRAVRALPDDWSRHRTIVLDELLPRDQQEALVAAVLDGLGVFATERAFGPDGAPLRAILPLRLLPRQPENEGDDGAGGERSDAEPDPPPPTDPPPKDTPPDDPPPKDTPPDGPIGDTDGSRPISPEPIDVDKHSIAMVLLIDRSYSMGVRLPNGQTKMSYAKTSALRTARALGEGDRVGIVTFGDKGFGRVALAMHDAADERAVRAGIEQLAHAREDTYLLSGLRLARDLLEKERAAVKHCVVVTDGEYRMGEQVALRAEANRMRREGKTTLSMISITDSSTDPQFLQLAELLTRDGGGRFLPVQDPTVVPVLVSAEVTRALSRVGREPRREGADPTAANDPPTDPPPPKPPEDEPPPPADADVREPEPLRRLPIYAVAESPLLLPEPEAWPTLGRAAATEAPLEARVLLVCGDEGWPLLAFANRGLGRVGAFGADLLGEAGGELRRAASFPAWLAQWVAATTPAQPGVDARERTDGGAVEPPAPVPDDVRWLTTVAGAPPVPQAADVDATVGYGARSRVGQQAPLLLLLLVLLAVAERALLARRLRRGRA